jgi:hypothetical protein
VGGITQMVCFTFADLTLISVNCAFAILFQQGLIILFLDERFSFKHDFPAFLLISGGAGLMVWTSSYEDIEYTKEDSENLLISFNYLVSLLICIGMGALQDMA